MEDTLGTVLSVLKSTPRRWIHLAETISPELLRRPAAPKEWSAHDCLQHMVDTERMVFPQRIGYLLRGEDFPAFDPDKDGAKQAGASGSLDLAREFDRLRAESVKMLSHLISADLSRSAKHRELGTVSLEEMLNEWAGHDLMHTVQGERAILQVFIAGCGPWKKYFSDHVAG